MIVQEAISHAMKLMRGDLEKVVKEALKTFSKDKPYHEDDYAIFDHFKGLYYQFLVGKKCDVTKVAFHFKRSHLDATEIMPDNLYTMLCLHGIYVGSFKSNLQTYETRLGTFMWADGKSKINFNYEVFLDETKLFISLSEDGVTYDKSLTDKYLLQGG